jgi:hypothetical protein
MAEQTETSKTEAPAAAPHKCRVEGCKRPYRAKGYCVSHYQKWRRGEVEGHRARYKVCSKEGCKKPAERWGVCAEHGKTSEAEAPAPAAG